ncbi:MAG: DUF1963 domain-containing protein [Streptomyces sp.]|nr:DUF1963 domain-containing protein [Streptomyces sp.]
MTRTTTRTTPPRPVDVEALFPEIVPFRREATRLHPRRGEPGFRDSSVGGPLLWPSAEPWPHCADDHPVTRLSNPSEDPVPLVPVLQLYAADVPDLPFPPGTDLLQLLWCPYDHERYYAPWPELSWRASGEVDDVLADPPRPADAPHTYLPQPCVVHPERVVEYPRWDLPEELSQDLKERFDRLKEQSGWSYWYALSVAPGVKAGGYPNWSQEPDWPDCADCGRRMDHLLTVDSAEFDGGSAKTWLPVEDRPPVGEIRDLPYEQRKAVQRAPGLMIGDMGGVYVFICPRCPKMPYDHRSDSS